MGTSLEESILRLKQELQDSIEEEEKQIAESHLDNEEYHKKLNIIDDNISKLEDETTKLENEIIGLNLKIDNFERNKNTEKAKLKNIKYKEIESNSQFYDYVLKTENKRFQWDIEDIKDKWENANFLLKIIRFPFKSKIDDEKDEITRSFNFKIKRIKMSQQNEIRLLNNEFNSNITIIDNKYKTPILEINKKINNSKLKKRETERELNKNRVHREYIISGDIKQVEDIFLQCKDILNHEKYPCRDEVMKLDKVISTFSPIFNNKYGILEDEKIQYIDDVKQQGKLKDIEKIKTEYIDMELNRCSTLFDDIDGKSLDTQQRTAVVTDENSNLVIAGAGSGKTLTIAAKTKYLVSMKNINSADILLITFTKKAANEMKERIQNKLNINVEVRTFHSLGYSILSHFRSVRPDVFSNMEDFINKFKNEIVPCDDELCRKVLMYFGTYMTDYVDPEDFETLGEYYCYNKSFSMESILSKLSNIKAYEIQEEMEDKIQKLTNNLENSITKKELLYKLEGLQNILIETKNKAKDQNLYFVQNVDEIIDDIQNIMDELSSDAQDNKEDLKNKQNFLNKAIEKAFKNNISFNRERVKSIEELIICNFFFANGIKYVYEGNYKHATGNREYRQYKPDFYLPDYDIYIEHFGVNEDYECPQYSKIEQIKYLQSMKWKRELHQKYETTLEETYSYQHKNGVLIKRLNEIIDKYNIKRNPLSKKELIESIIKLNNDTEFSDFYSLLATFLNLFNSNGYESEKIDSFIEEAGKLSSPYQRDKHLAFLEIFKRFQEEYAIELTNQGKIDFNDMINEATHFITSSRLPRSYKYKYIIIDEFQDISVSRFNLINALRKKSGAKIMAVGDDWQSIYRFAGSDISIFTKFREYFGTSEILRIEKTYRNSQQLIDIAETFITKNPDQIKKNLRSDKHLTKPVSLIWYKNTWDDENIDAIEDSIVRKLIYVLEHINEESKDIVLLGRNGFDIKMLEGSKLFNVIYTDDDVIVKSKLFPDLNIKFMTIHKSKGLEADEIIVLNNRNNTTGFPNKIVSDSILDYVIGAEEEFIYAEERRLFYVALTRTKNNCYFMVPEEYSNFIAELFADNAPSQYKDNINYMKISDSAIIKCPICKSGHLVVRTNSRDKSSFYSCNNYPQCDFTIDTIEPIKSKVRCPDCGGLMIKKNGKYGEFYGCKNYPLCRYTLNVEAYDRLNYDEEEQNTPPEPEFIVSDINDDDDEFPF